MEKHITVSMPGRSEEHEYHDMAVAPGTSVLDVLRETGIAGPSHYILEDEYGNKFVQGQNFYEVAEDGHKYFAIPDEARVGL